MQKLILLGLLTSMALSAAALDRVTVKELEQKLAAPVAAHGSELNNQLLGDTDLLQQLGQDAVLAPEIEGLELSERLTRVTLKKLLLKYQLGPQTQGALEQLADRSALLDPPAAEIPDNPPPDAETQRQMVASARAWVVHTLLRLPNFFATQTTYHFDDRPPQITWKDVPASTRLRLEGTSRREITFRDGKEVVSSASSPRLPKAMPQTGLESVGEFTTEPAMVLLLDLDSGAIAFHHWEMTLYGLAAVFRYSVPASGSHYEVNYSCSDKVPLHKSPGYHGTLSIDPASGAILRISLEADWKTGDPISHIASVIEYGPVVLGDRRYICPLRSLAFMVEEANVCARRARDQKLAKPVTLLNRVSFTDYHRLGSTATIIIEKPVNPDASPPAAPPDAPKAPDATPAPRQTDPH